MSEETNQQILAELRKLRHLLYLLLAVAISAAFPAVYRGFVHGPSDAGGWQAVNTAMRNQNFPLALSLAKILVDRQPNYYYGHSYMGSIYLATGDVTNAESQYSQAYQLFPNEQTEKDLAAVRKRRAMPDISGTHR